MGNCSGSSKTVNAVIPSITNSNNQSLKLQISSNYSYNVMISYCWANKDVCHLLADRLIENNFRVWIDRDKINGDIYSSMADAIDNSDCIILCISEPYFESVNCQREARYAADRNRPIIPIIVSEKYKPEKWLALIIAGKLYYKLDHNAQFSFDRTYDKIKEEVVCIQPLLNSSLFISEINKVTFNYV